MTSISDHIGNDLMMLRSAARLKQSAVAKKADVDASRLSRIETGEIPPSEEDVVRIAQSIATPEAEAFLAFRNQQWGPVPKPSFWNPDREPLATANLHLAMLEELDGDNIPTHSAAQAVLYKTALKQSSDFLSRLDHSVDFVGEIGVGKSAGICGITGLILPEDSNSSTALSKRTVLEVAAGRTTLCEVMLRSGPEHYFGLSVVPTGQDEVYRTVSDFCASLVDMHSEKPSGDNSSQTRGVPEEVGKALRNMSRMTRTKGKDEVGKMIQHDPIVMLIAALQGVLPEVTAEIVKCMQLEQRTRTEFRFEDENLSRGLTKLRDLFAQINKGQHPEVTLPKRIELTVPVALFDAGPLDISIVDTKGIDDTALRPDIRQRLDDPRSLTVLCSRFNSAPDDSVRETLESLVQTGAERTVSERIAVLVLARSNEVLDTQDDEGNRAETSEEGYRLKGDQVRVALAKIKGAEHVPVHFYDVIADRPDAIIGALVTQVRDLRARHVRQIQQVSQAVQVFIDSRQKAETEEAHSAVRHRLRTFLEQHAKLPPLVQSAKILFLNTLGSKHARTVWATTRRNGAWGGLHAYHLIGLGAASDAQKRCRLAFDALDSLLASLLGEPSFNAARDYIIELKRASATWREKFILEASGNGREISRAVLFDDDPIWNDCERQWGSGFRAAVAERLEHWFETHPTLFEIIEKRVADAWNSSFVVPLTDLSASVDSRILAIQ